MAAVRSPEGYRLIGCALSVAEQGWCHHDVRQQPRPCGHTAFAAIRQGVLVGASFHSNVNFHLRRRYISLGVDHFAARTALRTWGFAVCGGWGIGVQGGGGTSAQGGGFRILRLGRQRVLSCSATRSTAQAPIKVCDVLSIIIEGHCSRDRSRPHKKLSLPSFVRRAVSHAHGQLL